MQEYRNNLLKLLNENRIFLFPYFIIFSLFTLFYLINPKGNEIILVNHYHNNTLDFIFKMLSNSAEGYIYLIVLLILAVFRLKFLILGLLTFLIAGGVTQLLKRIYDYPRPKIFFGNEIINNLNLVEGVKLNSLHSFPSGHSTAAFSMMFFLALIVQNKTLKFCFFALATLMAFSRIYLVQHFVSDVVAGSFIGIFTTLLIYTYFNLDTKITQSNWFNYSINEKYKNKK